MNPEELYAAAVEAGMEAGMSEIAISVLHNIGNAVTPLKLKLASLIEKISKKDFLFLEQLKNLIDLQTKHSATDKELLEFYTQNPKGKKFPHFLKVFLY